MTCISAEYQTPTTTFAKTPPPGRPIAWDQGLGWTPLEDDEKKSRQPSSQIEIKQRKGRYD